MQSGLKYVLKKFMALKPFSCLKPIIRTEDPLTQEGRGTCLLVQWLKLCAPSAGAQVQSLVRELEPGTAK